eukprot:CAMPEP_0115034304 /NCGR_PEP_ID=MMETSP0216-20121206/40559_1 /TAXON_ID=223996 /ORGANISM="Protocruzia adherens, Strain Boccale" /LENGTH=149 /DNA_ID=CAMNT_0002413139 /DNA_START=1194 /DNA_END=1640 /DNA_ORIENTATION=-
MDIHPKKKLRPFTGDSTFETTLPKSLTEFVFKYLEIEDFCILQMVNKRWLQCTYSILHKLKLQFEDQRASLTEELGNLPDLESNICIEKLNHKLSSASDCVQIYNGARQRRKVENDKKPSASLIKIAMVLSKHVGPYRNFDTPIDRVNW